MQSWLASEPGKGCLPCLSAAADGASRQDGELQKEGWSSFCSHSYGCWPTPLNLLFETPRRSPVTAAFWWIFPVWFLQYKETLKIVHFTKKCLGFLSWCCINKKYIYWFTFIYLYILEKKMQLSWFSPPESQNSLLLPCANVFNYQPAFARCHGTFAFSFQATLWCHWTGTGAAWKRAEVKEHNQKCCSSGIRHPCRVKIAWLKTPPVIKKAHCMRLHSWNISSPVVCFSETYHQPTSR